MPLSKFLQKKQLEIEAAQDAILITILLLKEKQQNAEQIFDVIWKVIDTSLKNLKSY